MWAKLVHRKDLLEGDFALHKDDEFYRGPVKNLNFDTTTGILTITTKWLARFEITVMKWVSWPEPRRKKEFRYKVVTKGVELEDTGSFVQLRKKPSPPFAFLVPNSYSKLTADMVT